jgi:hypothetical protein
VYGGAVSTCYNRALTNNGTTGTKFFVLFDLARAVGEHRLEATQSYPESKNDRQIKRHA